MSDAHGAEMEAGERFAFGDNWRRFIEELGEARIQNAERTLLDMLEVETLAGRSFLDVGCGSGLFSLAARRLGARVRSFDYDPASVACARELKRRFLPADEGWIVTEGSVLDRGFLASLGSFDVVYSWGVLHHTGRMWEALENVVSLVAPAGRLFIAIYHDDGASSRRWLWVKKVYNRLPPALRFLVLWPAFAALWAPATVRDLLLGRPFHTWRHYYGSVRGMSPWRDAVDWIGGYPYEFAMPEQIFDFYRRRGFGLARLRTVNGLGCDEFVFERSGKTDG